jgi:hypothetical protein
MVHDDSQVVNQIDERGLVHTTRMRFKRGRLSEPTYEAQCDRRLDVVATFAPVTCFQCLRLELGP